MVRRRVAYGLGALALGVAAAGALTAYEFSGRGGDEVKYIQNGEASWYGPGFHGKKTASGEIYDQNDLTAAHRKLPLGSEVTVINKETGQAVEVEINDRGPYAKGREIDLSKAAAQKLGIVEDGTADVRIEATEEQLDPDRDGKPGAK